MNAVKRFEEQEVENSERPVREKRFTLFARGTVNPGNLNPGNLVAWVHVSGRLQRPVREEGLAVVAFGIREHSLCRPELHHAPSAEHDGIIRIWDQIGDTLQRYRDYFL